MMGAMGGGWWVVDGIHSTPPCPSIRPMDVPGQ